MLGRSKWSVAWFHYNSISLKLAYIKNKMFKTLHTVLIQRYAQFWFFINGSGNSFFTTFYAWFFNKNIPHVILSSNQISLSDCLYFLRYWAICILQLFINQVITSWILELTLSFQSSCFFYMTKKSWHKLKYLENEKSL